jgi:hypothetical protein
MNINIRIDITPGTARRVAYMGLTMLAVGFAAVAYAVPVTFVSHRKLTAEQLNENFANLDAQIASLRGALDTKQERSPLPVVTEWQQYTPKLSTDKGALVQGQTTIGYYRRVGDSLEATTFSAFTAAPNSGAKWWQCTLPDGLTIDFKKIGVIGDVTVGGGLAQRLSENVVLGTYIRSATGVTAVANGSSSVFIDDDTPIEFREDAFLSFYFTVPIEGWTATQ